MKEQIKTVTLEPVEFLTVLTILKVHKQLAVDTDDNAEQAFLQVLIDKLLEYKYADDHTVWLDLSTKTRFAIWLALDGYKQFCEASGNQPELNLVVTAMSKFS